MKISSMLPKISSKISKINYKYSDTLQVDKYEKEFDEANPDFMILTGLAKKDHLNDPEQQTNKKIEFNWNIYRY